MTPIANLALATTAFVGGHLALSHLFRRPLVRSIGERGFLGVYSLVALATFGWMIWARLQTPVMLPFWIAPVWFQDLATLLMLFAAILMVGSLHGNPAMVNPDRDMRVPERAVGVFAITRHPMMWAFMLWAVVHIILWGSAANLILCVGILVLACAGSLGQDAKKRRLLGPDWIEWQRRTAYVPFSGQLSGRLAWRDARPGWVASIGGVGLWLAATYAHAPAGGPVAGVWRWILA